MSHNIIEGNLNAKGLKFAVLVSRFNNFITERLLSGALDALGRSVAAHLDALLGAGTGAAATQ